MHKVEKGKTKFLYILYTSLIIEQLNQEFSNLYLNQIQISYYIQIYIKEKSYPDMNNNWRFKKISNFFKIQWLKYRGTKKFYLFATLFYTGILGYIFKQKIQQKIQGGDFYHQLLTKTIQSFSQQKIPYFLRSYLYTKYATKFNVNLAEIEKPLAEYENFSEFFIRKIKARESNKQLLENNRIVCCPCDSEILNISKVTQDQNIIVKDVNYSLNKLLFGELRQQQKINDVALLKQRKQNDLHQVIFYLCPGDYHRFHAPTNLTILSTRALGSKLRPVNIKSLLKTGGKVYEENARKILHGYYQAANPQFKNYIGLVMIGALNVSDIVINQKWDYMKGQQIGYFNLGSTIVMLIESHGDLKWNKKTGDKVKFGQKLCQFT